MSADLALLFSPLCIPVPLPGCPLLNQAAQAAGQVGAAAGDLLLGAILKIFAFFLYLLLKLSLFFLALAGTIYNWVVTETVFRFAQNFGNSEGLLVAWNIIRDFGNIFLLFGFIFLGIATILNLQNYNAKKTLVRLLLFALLLNFSLFTAEAIVDTTNAVSYVLSSQAGGTCEGQVSSCATDRDRGVAGRIITATGVAGLFSWDSQGGDFTRNLGFTGNLEDYTIASNLLIIWAIVATSMFVAVVMMVLLSASILLVTRAVVLVFLIITSPIGFVGAVIPYLGGLAKDWWTSLLKHSFFAPIYLLLVFISLKILEAVVGNVGNGQTLFETLKSPDVSAMGALVIFIVVTTFMVGAIVFARKFGVYGADVAVGFASKTASFVTGGGGLAPISGLYRATAGRLGAGTSAVGAWAARRIPLVGPKLGEVMRFRGEQLASSNLDVRRMVGGLVPSAAGADLFGRSSEAAQRGYRGVREDIRRRGMEQLRAYERGGPSREELAALRDHDRNLLEIQRQLVEAIRDGREADAEHLREQRELVIMQRRNIVADIESRNLLRQHQYQRNVRWASHMPGLNDGPTMRELEGEIGRHLSRSEMRRFIDDAVGAIREALPGAAASPERPEPAPRRGSPPERRT